MYALYQFLHVQLKSILVMVRSSLDKVDNMLYFFVNVDRRLLVLCRWIAQKGSGCLELEGGVEVGQEPQSDGGVERDARQTIEGVRSMKISDDCESVNVSRHVNQTLICRIMVL
jgi:hypothetical protein